SRIWGLSQILDAYRGIAELVEPVRHATGGKPPVQIMHGTAANLQGVEDASVDLICFDPPYYNNVQYAELSDYFYVWQKRTLGDLYPSRYRSRLTNKSDEAVANPCRDSGSAGAKEAYERMMGEIFAEAMRVLKPEGIMTLMFTHKSQDAWETLTRSLIETGWVISAALPVESEFANSQNIMENASAVSSIFISCRKGTPRETPSLWSGFGDTGVQSQIREAVKEGLQEFEKLRLNAVDEMVGSYGRALRVLSQNWPVYDGEEQVSPVRAMNEASQVVAQHQMSRISRGVLTMEDLSSEAGMALTLFGTFGLGEFPFNEALNLSRSLGIALENRNGNYNPGESSIGVSTHQSGNRARGNREDQQGYPAPLVQRGNKLRLALPEERFSLRMEKPATEWDLLQGTLMAFREGDVPVARGYLERSAGEKLPLVVEMLKVWSESVGDEKLHQEAQALLFGLKP
ncbi:MAG TPA: hypothetical protein PLA80_13105, partial [Synergistaceae bacterium]|nr:hypothetical protein [Synergistaceae bacterium]